MLRQRKHLSANKLVFPLIVVVAGLVVIIGAWLVVRHYSEQKAMPSAEVKDFDVQLTAKSNTDFSYDYQLEVQTDIESIADSKKEITLQQDIVEANKKNVAVTVAAIERAPVVRDCGPTGLCLPPEKAAVNVTIPGDVLMQSTQFTTKVMVQIGKKQKAYVLERDGYILALKQSSKTITRYPFYPDGVTGAITLKTSWEANCDHLNGQKLTNALRSDNVRVANDTYPGIGKLDTKNDAELIITSEDMSIRDSVIPIDEKGCMVRLSAPSLGPL